MLDGNGKSSLFKVISSNLTLRNMVIRNCNDSALLVGQGSILNTVNVTFEDNHVADNGAVVYCDGSDYYSRHDTFKNNYAELGGSAIYGDYSILSFDNSIFANQNSIYWSLIYGSNCIINVSSSIFANTTSKYATAIYNNYKVNIKKSKFINLHANETAGGIAIKGPSIANESYLSVEECEFINVTATKNGGAIFADILGATNDLNNGLVEIINSTFKQCSGDFGGAMLQLGGECEIINSLFAENSAAENGGALYTSNASVLIVSTSFENNELDEYSGLGGAVYLDYGIAIIGNSTFKDNVAKQGGAIFSFNNQYKIADSKFKNNGEDIHTRFDKDGSAITNCGKYTSTINDNEFDIGLRYNGEEIKLNPLPIAGSASDSYFNLKDQGLVTPVKNQGSMGACWAFGAVGAFESAFLIATNTTLDLSENNVQNLGLRYSIYGNPECTESGTSETSTSYFVSWLGAINTTGDTYDELGKISAIKIGPETYRVVDAIFVDIKNKTAIKEALTKYGALNLFVYGADPKDGSYNNETAAVYNSKNNGNHYVTLVGWNDTFSKSNFKTTPPGDGAWICKNSWGTDWGDEGYFYLSYYDKSLQVPAVGFMFENVEPYEMLHQNELNGADDYNTDYDTYGHLFTSQNGDIIAAVGTYFEKANAPYTISVYINDYLAYTQKGSSDHAGYNTIKLDKHLCVDINSTFEIRIKSTSLPLVQSTRMPITPNLNYVIIDGEYYFLSKEGVIAPVKVYTYHNPFISSNIVKYYTNKDTIFTLNDVSEWGNLKVSFNGKSCKVEIKNNTASVNLGVLKVGSHLVSITYNNKTFENQILVKSTIDIPANSITIGYNAKLTYTVVFYDANGKPLKNQKVSIKFDGKTLTGYTGKKGDFPIEIEKGCKIGTHTIDITNPKTKEKAKVTVKIVSRFSGNKNVNMYYYDGSKYTVRVKNAYGNFVGKNKVVTITIGKKKYKVKTNAKGYATLKIPSKITPGKYTITAKYAGQTVKNTLKVKQVLTTKKTVKVKKCSKKLVLKATLKKGKTPLKNKVVKFKVNGKTYKAKTNKKGIAKVTIKKAAIKKLKVKKYTIKVSYLSDVVKATLKVKC